MYGEKDVAKSGSIWVFWEYYSSQGEEENVLTNLLNRTQSNTFPLIGSIGHLPAEVSVMKTNESGFNKI